MSRYGLSDFVDHSRQRDRGHGLFELESERLLEVNLEGMIWMKHGAMVAYRGDVRFEREKILEKGLVKALKKGLTGEGARLTRCEGNGQVYLADAGKKVTILELAGETIFVNGSDVLAFEDALDWDVKMLRKASAILAGGLFNLRLAGSGMLALTTHYDPLTLLVEPGNPVYTDPNATVAWSGDLTPEFKTDIQLKSLVGRSSGESFQMMFDGTGFVVVQPYEERAMQSNATQ